jgi:hypothetical protein
MITLTREEAQQVLDALICSGPHGWSPNLVNQHNKALKTLRARLSAPEPNYRDVVIKGDLWRIEFLPDHAASVVLVRANYEAQPEPSCKTGSQCIGGKCPQCVVTEPVGWIYEDDEGRMMFSQMPTSALFWEPVYKSKLWEKNSD